MTSHILKFFRPFKQLLVALGLIRRKPKAIHHLVDDRFEEVVAWIGTRPGKRHIVACALFATAEKMRRMGLGANVEIHMVNRIATGVMWRDPDMCLSCTYTMQSSELHAQLTNRLKGSNPEYNVVLRSGIKPIAILRRADPSTPGYGRPK